MGRSSDRSILKHRSIVHTNTSPQMHKKQHKVLLMQFKTFSKEIQERQKNRLVENVDTEQENIKFPENTDVQEDIQEDVKFL